MIQGESRERNDPWYHSHHTCTLALRELRQTMRWRLWDSNNPSVRTKSRSEKNTGKTKGKTKRGSETGKQMNRLSPKLMSWGSLLSIYSLLPIPSYTDIKKAKRGMGERKGLVFLVPTSPPRNLSVGVQCSSVPYQSLL